MLSAYSGRPPLRSAADARALAQAYLAAAAALDVVSGGGGGDNGGGGGPTRLYRCDCVSHEEVCVTLARALACERWDGEPWAPAVRCAAPNLVWAWAASAAPPDARDALLVWQRVNHLAALRPLSRKDKLARRLRAAAVAHGAFFDGLAPTTFVLPADYVAFVDAFTRAATAAADGSGDGGGGDDMPLWIMKPAGLSRGRGIFLLDELGACSYAQPYVVQRYITQPLLMDGYKWDLRLYVLVTAQPSEAWLYSEGLARFCSARYASGGGRAADAPQAAHLTNASLAAARGDQPPPPLRSMPRAHVGANKCSLAALWAALRARGVDADALWGRAVALVRRALFAGLGPGLAGGGGGSGGGESNGFELLGLDVMFDCTGRPWLLEMNASPSLDGGTPFDAALKTRLLADTVTVVRPLPFRRDALAAIMRRRAAEAASGGASATAAGRPASEERFRLNADLQAVLGGATPRRAGDPPPDDPGLYLRLAPSAEWDALRSQSRAAPPPRAAARR